MQEGVKETYSVISEMYDIWRQESDYDTILYERFVASHSGLFAMYPATEMPDGYDHLLTDWFNAAIAHHDTLVITPPRNNEFRRCDVTTIAQTLLEGK